jgi:hypothetical protein
MKRREFIVLLGGAAVSGPVKAYAPETDRVRLVGVLMNVAADSSEAGPRILAFKEALQRFGWIEGRNLRWRSVGVQTTRTPFASMRPSWSHSRQTLFWLLAP